MVIKIPLPLIPIFPCPPIEPRGPLFPLVPVFACEPLGPVIVVEMLIQWHVTSK